MVDMDATVHFKAVDTDNFLNRMCQTRRDCDAFVRAHWSGWFSVVTSCDLLSEASPAARLRSAEASSNVAVWSPGTDLETAKLPGKPRGSMCPKRDIWISPALLDLERLARNVHFNLYRW